MPIHPAQRGFRQHQSTYNNINDICNTVKQLRNSEKRLRELKVKPSKRQKQFVLLLDLSKAFDSVNRTKLLRSLHQRGVSSTTVHAIAQVLSSTTHIVEADGLEYPTTTGVPQGSVLSPLLFSVYIDSLIRELVQLLPPKSTDKTREGPTEGPVSPKTPIPSHPLSSLAGCPDTGVDPAPHCTYLNQPHRVLAFADDLLVVCNQDNVQTVIERTQEWCRTHDFALNLDKTKALQIKVDRRTKTRATDSLHGIQVVSSATYLGSIIDDDCSFRSELELIKK